MEVKNVAGRITQGVLIALLTTGGTFGGLVFTGLVDLSKHTDQARLEESRITLEQSRLELESWRGLVVDLRAEVVRLTGEVGTLRTEVATLRAENYRLRRTIEQLPVAPAQFAPPAQPMQTRPPIPIPDRELPRSFSSNSEPQR